MTPTNNTSFLRGAWAITKPGMSAMLETLEAVKAGIDFEDFVTTRGKAGIDGDGIAHVHVKGSLLDNAPAIFEKVGSTDYRSIRAEVDAAKSEGAKAIMFTVDSPGGTVAGLKEAANAIQGAGIPTLAYCDGMACSAAYYLASAADDIAASPSAEVGNIGTVLAWWNDSKLLEEIGLSMEVITNEGADLKGTFRDNPMSESQREFLQQEVNAAGQDFQDHVSSNRDVDAEVFRAGWYSGEKAQSLGLVDAIGSFDEARQALVRSLG